MCLSRGYMSEDLSSIEETEDFVGLSGGFVVVVVLRWHPV